MNREILFRGKSIDNKEWVEGFYAVKGKDTDYERHCIVENTFDSNTNSYPFYFTDIEIDPKTVCQYTGILDKYGNKIFEGDIFYDRNGNSFSVEFINGSFIVIPTNEITKKVIGRRWFFEIAGFSHELEVISNIFDNPELIGDNL